MAMRRSAYKIFRRSVFDVMRDCFTAVGFTLAVIGAVLIGLRETEISSRAEGLRLLEDGVRRAVTQCYAIEGSYPESLQYIKDHYGLYVDSTRYAVHYEIFASNILPDITVIELGEFSEFSEGGPQ